MLKNIYLKQKISHYYLISGYIINNYLENKKII